MNAPHEALRLGRLSQVDSRSNLTRCIHDDLTESAHRHLNEAYSGAYGAAEALSGLPSALASDLAEKLAGICAQIEDAQGLLRKYDGISDEEYGGTR